MPELTLKTVGVEDLPAILELTRACDIADTGEVDFVPEDVEVALGQTGDRIWALAAPDSSLQALAWISREPDMPSQTAEYFVHPSQPVEIAAPVIDAMLDAMADDPARRKLHVMVAASAAAKSASLVERGATVVRHFFRMAIPLDQPIPAPVWPAGAVLTTTTDTDEDLRPMHLVLSEAFEDHWEHRSSDFDTWQARHRSRPDFDPSLYWLVRVNGEPAAATVCLRRGDGDDADAGGFVGAIGVRRPYRGTGLARQLLMVAFNEFAQRGFTEASLYVDSTNPTGAVRLYESVGMHVAAKWDCLEFPAPTQ